MNDLFARLEPLILELQDLPGWPVTALPAGLLLYDILSGLGATQAELEETLGREVLALVESPVIRDFARSPCSPVC
jgi:hypothetical protein